MLAQATPAPAAGKQAMAHTPKGKAVDADEARITDLHAKLKITPAQEDLWSGVTTVMRANAKTMEPLKAGTVRQGADHDRGRGFHILRGDR